MRTPSAPPASVTASACELPTPEAINAAAPAPTCVAAPAGPIGTAAAAAPAQSRSSASGSEKPTPSVPSRRKEATARRSQQADTSAHASDNRRRRGGAGTYPPAEPKAQGALASGEAWEDEQQARGGNARDGDHREPGAHADPAAQCGRYRSKRREGDSVDQAEDDQGKTERTHAGATAWIAANDGYAHRVVETARKHDTDQGGTAVAGRKRE